MIPFRALCRLTAIALLAGCAGDRAHREGIGLMAEGKYEQGLARLEESVREDPDNTVFKADLARRREDALNRLMATASSHRASDRHDEAEAVYRRILAMNPGHERAKAGLDELARDRRHAVLLEKAREAVARNDVAAAQVLLKMVAAENPGQREMLELRRRLAEQQMRLELAEPVLKPSQDRPINLEFRDANLRMVFEALARNTGVSFVLDKDVRPDLRTTVFLRQASLEDAIELLLQTNRLEKKVLSRNTVLIFPNTPEKQKDYQELVVKGFYLANADAKQTQAMVKSLLKTKDTWVDEKLNLLLVRDTPEAIRMVERLIAMQDLNEPEVMLELEVLEVKRTRLTELGIKWPDKLTLVPLPSTGDTVTLTDLRTMNSDRIGATLTSAIINLHRDVGDVNILANPRIRAKNREKAKVLIGDKVPVITTTSNSMGFVSESVQYLDVGLKLEMDPVIQLHDGVTIRVNLEVSSVVKEVRSAAGTLSYQIGTRSASTVLNLKDGETQILAGLISDEDRTTASRVPGLGDLPLIGRLFSSQKDDSTKTEIVLSVTPRLVRNINRPDVSASEFWSGTETLLRARPLKMSDAQKQEPATEASAGRDATPAAMPSPAAPEAGIASATLGWQGPAQVKVGETFAVALVLKSDGALRSLPFQLGFDPAAFQVVGVTEGGYFSQQGVRTNFSSQTDPSGRIFVGVARPGSDGTKGEAPLAMVTLRALAPKPASELRVLSATPVATGDRPPQIKLPPPLAIAITR